MSGSYYIGAPAEAWDRADERLALLRALNRETVIEYLKLTGRVSPGEPAPEIE